MIADVRARLSGFHALLALIAAGALSVRVVAAFLSRDHPVQGDALVFHTVARHLADGDGFNQAFRDGATAEHPPAWEVVLAVAHLVGANGYLSQRLVGALIGTVTVVLIGLLGRTLVSSAVGLTAAAIAAIYPMLWAADVSIMSETLYGAFLVGALLAAAHKRAVVLGVLLGLAVLTRGEALALLVFLVPPLFWRQWRPLLACYAAFAVVLAPWTIRNVITFEKPPLVSNNANGIWIGANCPDVYSGPLIGSWRFQCYLPEREGEDESEFFARQREAGFEYMFDNADRLPAVVFARFLRLVDAKSVGQSLYLNAAEGRTVASMKVGIRMAWLVMLLAVAGAILLRRDRRALLVLLAPVAMVLAVGLATYGSSRFRFGAEPALTVLAAVAVVALLRTLMTQFQVRSSRRTGRRVVLSQGQ